MHLFDRALVADLLEHVSHVSFGLVGLLQFVEELGLLKFELLGILLGAVGEVVGILDSCFVALF